MSRGLGDVYKRQAYDDIEGIVKEFVKFVKKCEKYDTK